MTPAQARGLTAHPPQVEATLSIDRESTCVKDCKTKHKTGDVLDLTLFEEVGIRIYRTNATTLKFAHPHAVSLCRCGSAKFFDDDERTLTLQFVMLSDLEMVQRLLLDWVEVVDTRR